MAAATRAVAEATGAVAKAAKPSGESQGAEVKTPQPTPKPLGAPQRRSPLSVLKVSQLLLGAIASHEGLTMATLKKELGNAGYQVRRKCRRHWGAAPKSETRGALLRVSGTNASGYFRVWKAPKPKRKPGRPRLAEGARAWRRSPAVRRSPRRRCARRKAAKKAREVWRRNARAQSSVKRLRSRARDPGRSRAKEETKAKVMDEGRGRTKKEDRPRARDENRPREEKKHDPEKPIKRTVLRSASRAARAKASTKFESPCNATGNP